MLTEASGGGITILGTRSSAKKTEVTAAAKDMAVETAKADHIEVSLPDRQPRVITSHHIHLNLKVSNIKEVEKVVQPRPTQQVIEEPVQYANETIEFGSLSINPEPEPVVISAPATTAKPAAKAPKKDYVISGEVFDFKNFEVNKDRPKGWAEIKLRRVYLKEWEDRKNGVDEDDILDKRFQREQEVTNLFLLNDSAHSLCMMS
jgi:hypothetical protein